LKESWNLKNSASGAGSTQLIRKAKNKLKLLANFGSPNTEGLIPKLAFLVRPISLLKSSL